MLLKKGKETIHVINEMQIRAFKKAGWEESTAKGNAETDKSKSTAKGNAETDKSKSTAKGNAEK